jgi:hypothetical protein
MNKSFLRGAGRHRRAGWRSPSFAVKFARRLRARQLSGRDFPARPARQIALQARRREDERLTGGRHV